MSDNKEKTISTSAYDLVSYIFNVMENEFIDQLFELADDGDMITCEDVKRFAKINHVTITTYNTLNIE
jgi:hypothetical protein